MSLGHSTGLKHQFLYLLASSETHTSKAAAVKDFAKIRLQREATRSTVRQGLGMMARSSPRWASAAVFGIRILPVVGYALLAYDIWNLYDKWSED